MVEKSKPSVFVAAAGEVALANDWGQSCDYWVSLKTMSCFFSGLDTKACLLQSSLKLLSCPHETLSLQCDQCKRWKDAS
jgi:hypothetical protein